MNKKVKIFSADYLMNNELTDEDLKTLLGDHQLIYSLIIEMFKISKHTLSENEIIDKVTKDNKWVYKYYWTKNQRKKFENELTEIFKNVYCYTGKELSAHVQMWMINYGLSIKGNNMFD